MILKKPLFSTFILLLFILIDPSFTQSESELEFNFNQGTLPEEVVIEMAKRESRYHHFIWHNVRDNWNKLSPRGQQQIRDLGWAPPNPARQVSNGYSVVILDNLSGEDFLYMHRQMINKVNDILNQSGGSYGSNITGWTIIPAPGDRDWPVPDRYTIPGDENKTRYVTQWKTTSFYNTNIKPNEDIFTNPRQLRRMTLAELGARIDATVHGYMHLRFSGRSEYGYRPQTTSLLPDIDEQWDDPEYNWLVDVYSSAVNPTFWKLHGWIDDRIEDWRRANGLSNITWNGTWTGGPMEEIDFLWDRKEGPMTVGEGRDGDDDIMKKVGRIFAEEGLETSFADPVFVEVPKILLKSKAKRRLCNIKPKRKSSR